MLYSVVCEDIIHCTFPRKVHCFFDCWKDGTVRIRENLPDSIFLFYGGGREADRVAEVLYISATESKRKERRRCSLL